MTGVSVRYVEACCKDLEKPIRGDLKISGNGSYLSVASTHKRGKPLTRYMICELTGKPCIMTELKITQFDPIYISESLPVSSYEECSVHRNREHFVSEE